MYMDSPTSLKRAIIAMGDKLDEIPMLEDKRAAAKEVLKTVKAKMGGEISPGLT